MCFSYGKGWFNFMNETRSGQDLDPKLHRQATWASCMAQIHPILPAQPHAQEHLHFYISSSYFDSNSSYTARTPEPTAVRALTPPSLNAAGGSHRGFHGGRVRRLKTERSPDTSGPTLWPRTFAPFVNLPG